jgi:hypothetical protein
MIRTAGLAFVVLAVALGGCERSASLLAGEPWPPRPPELPVEARAAIEAGEAWEGTGAAAAAFQVLEARSEAEWNAMWALVGRAPPGSLAAGRTAVGIFLGTASPAVRVSTLQAIPVAGTAGTPPATLVTYGVLGAGIGGGGRSPWAIRLLPQGTGRAVRTEEVRMPATARTPVVPGPEAEAALARGLAFEGDDARLPTGGLYLATDGAGWARLWAAAGRPAPGPLPSGAKAVGVFAGTQPVGGARVFTGAAATDTDGTTVLRYAVQPPDAGAPAGGGRRPWAIRILPGAAGEVAAIDLEAEAALAPWHRRSVAALVNGVPAPRRPVTALPPEIQVPAR